MLRLQQAIGSTTLITDALNYTQTNGSDMRTLLTL